MAFSIICLFCIFYTYQCLDGEKFLCKPPYSTNHTNKTIFMFDTGNDAILTGTELGELKRHVYDPEIKNYRCLQNISTE